MLQPRAFILPVIICSALIMERYNTFARLNLTYQSRPNPQKVPFWGKFTKSKIIHFIFFRSEKGVSVGKGVFILFRLPGTHTGMMV